MNPMSNGTIIRRGEAFASDSKIDVRATQVDGQIDSMSMAVDDLTHLVTALCARLEPVTTPVNITSQAGGANPSPPMVELARRLGNQSARVNEACDALRNLITGLEI